MNSRASKSVYVMVKGEKIQKEYDIQESQTLLVEFFENISGDGFVVVYLRESK